MKLGSLGTIVGGIGGAILGGPGGAIAGASIGSALGGFDKDGVVKQADQFGWNANLQREFAQNSIQWKVQDAIKAGIHPLAALGASGYSASPVQIDNSSAMIASQNRNDLLKGVQSYAENRLAKERMKQEAELSLQRQLAENNRVQSEVYSNWAQAQQALTMANLMAQTGTYPGMPVSSSDTSFGFGLWHSGSSEYPRAYKVSGGPNAQWKNRI